MFEWVKKEVNLKYILLNLLLFLFEILIIENGFNFDIVRLSLFILLLRYCKEWLNNSVFIIGLLLIIFL